MNLVEMAYTFVTEFIVRGCYFYDFSPHLQIYEWYTVVQRIPLWSVAHLGTFLNLAE
jgi:hypothetical protein